MKTIFFPDVKIRITGTDSQKQLAAALIEAANFLLTLSTDEIISGGTLESPVLCLEYEQGLDE